MDVVCRHSNNPDAQARVISRANAGLYGNIIIGGGIGAIIDHSRGTAYTYPGWIRLVFGKKLVLDRANESEGQPVTDAGIVVKRAQNDMRRNDKVSNNPANGVVTLEDLKDLLRDGEAVSAPVPSRSLEKNVSKENGSGLEDFRDLLIQKKSN